MFVCLPRGALESNKKGEPQEAPRRPQDGSRGPQEAPRRPQRSPERPPNGSQGRGSARRQASETRPEKKSPELSRCLLSRPHVVSKLFGEGEQARREAARLRAGREARGFRSSALFSASSLSAPRFSPLAPRTSLLAPCPSPVTPSPSSLLVPVSLAPPAPQQPHQTTPRSRCEVRIPLYCFRLAKQCTP